MKKSIRILLLEDNNKDCESFKRYEKDKKNITLVSITDSVSKALNDVLTHKPEAIIVDIELNSRTSDGNGIIFLKRLSELKLNYQPVIVVTTNTVHELVYEKSRNYGVAFVLYKQTKDYSAEKVIESIFALIEEDRVVERSLSNEYVNEDLQKAQTDRITALINKELDLIGIEHGLLGRAYIVESLKYLLKINNPNEERLYKYLHNLYKKSPNNISTNIQTAIDRAWRTYDITELEQHFTAKYDPEKGVPSPTQLIYYYRDKIKAQI